MLKELLYAAHKAGVSVDFRPTSLEDYERWVAEQGKERRVITLLGRRLTAGQIASVASVVAENRLNIDVITRLSGRVSLRDERIHPDACVQFTVSGHLSDEFQMRSRLPWGMAPTICLCLASPGWVSLSMPSRWCANRPGKPSPAWG